MMPDLHLRSVTEADIREFATWRYEPPYDVYSITQPVDESVEYFLRPTTNCHVIESEGELAGFFTIGSDAQVPGGDYSVSALDIGLGMKPSMTGQGYGAGFVATVVRFVRDTSDIGGLRVSIAAGNQRALRVWRGCGFTETQRFQTPRTILGSDEFVMLVSD